MKAQSADMHSMLCAVERTPAAAAQQAEVQGQRGGGRGCRGPGSCCCCCRSRVCCPGQTLALQQSSALNCSFYSCLLLQASVVEVSLNSGRVKTFSFL